MSPTTKTVLEVLNAGATYLEKASIEQPRLACELLLARLLNCKRLELYLKYDAILPERLLQAMRRGIQRVHSGEPVQYVLGEAGFRDQVLKVDKRALIPRPETELLVEAVLTCSPLWEAEHPLIVDVGTGSGCIILSLAEAKPEGRYVALDIDADALSLARENAEQVGMTEHVVFAQAEMCDVLAPQTVSAVVANLPYIKSAVYESLPPQIREHEPKTALDGGEDGLRVIESVIGDACIVLSEGGFVFLEIGEDQGDEVSLMLDEAGFSQVRVVKALNDRNRVVFGCLD